MDQLQRAPRRAAIGAALRNDVILTLITERLPRFRKREHAALLRDDDRWNANRRVAVFTVDEDIEEIGLETPSLEKEFLTLFR